MVSNIYIGILALTFTLPLVKLVQPLGNINYPLLVTLVLLFFFMPLINKKKEVTYVDIFFIYYLFNILVNRVLLDDITINNFRYLIQFPVSAFCAYNIVKLSNQRVVSLLLQLMIAWAVINSIYAIIQVTTNSFYWPSQTEILTRLGEHEFERRNYFEHMGGGNLQHPGLGVYATVMSLGHYLIIILPLIIYKVISTNTIFYRISTLLVLTGIVITFSRGSLLAAFLVCFLMLHHEDKVREFFPKKINRKWFLLCLYLFIGIAIYYFYSMVDSYINANEKNYYVRANRWVVVWHYAVNFPARLVFGFGPFYFRDVVFPQFHLTSNLHNAFIQLFLELGVVGSALFLKIMYKNIRILITHNSHKVAFVNYGIIAFLLSQMFDHTFFGFHGVIIFMLLSTFEFIAMQHNSCKCY